MSRKRTFGHLGATLGVIGSVVALVPSDAGADLTGWAWSSTGGTLQQGSRSNVVGFWQVLGREKHPCPGSYYDGIFGPKTADMTRRMQSEVAGVAATGVVDWSTWHHTQTANDSFGIPRLSRTSGTSGNAGYFSYYNGSSWTSEHYWQGNPSSNPGTGLWKFRVPSSGLWFNATSAETMGSYTAC